MSDFTIKTKKDNRVAGLFSAEVDVKLPGDLIGKNVFVKNLQTNEEYAAYIEKTDDNEKPTVTTLLPLLVANTVFGFDVIIDDMVPNSLTPININESQPNHIKFSLGEDEFTQFHFNEDNDRHRPYFYPLNAPCGVGVTRDFPIADVEGDQTDHIHHTGLWTAWGKVNGSDNWAAEKTSGWQKVKDSSIKIKNNSIYTQIDTDIEWLNRKQSKVDLDEHRTIKIYNVSHSQSRIMDFDIRLTPRKKNVKFGDTKEGGFLSVRVKPVMNVNSKKGGVITNSEGKKSKNKLSESKVWGKSAAWCDYSGIVEGQKVGVAIMDHPKNVNHPTTWHVRNYGLMTANPFGLSHFVNKKKNGSYILKVGEELRFRYRLIVHDGDAKSANLVEEYANYIE